MSRMVWQTIAVPDDYDVLAPDGSEIRVLAQLDRGSMVHCQLAPGHVTQAVRHRTVEELWLCIAGQGEVWRRDASDAEIVRLQPGVSVSIPLGVDFQFRATGDEALQVVITTMPPWPGPDEAIPSDGPWQPQLGEAGAP
jgi:mannose-6-phosphate isomerase-like protein (cupin superfamily)